MTREKEIELNFAIAKSIIINQLCIESNEALKDFPKVYRHNLKFHSNKTIEELEKRLSEFDQAFEKAEEFMLYTQQRIELITPLLAGLRIDELSNLPDLIMAYNKRPEACQRFINKVLERNNETTDDMVV